MTQRIFAVAVFAIGLFVATGTVSAAPCLPSAVPLACLSVDPAVSDVMAGDVFTVSVKIWDVSDLIGYDVELGFDPAILRVLSIADDRFLDPSGTGNFLSDFDNGAGELFAADVRPSPGVSDSGAGAKLYTVTFKARAPGSSALDFDLLCERGDSFCTALSNSNGPIPFSTVPGLVNVTGTVPELSILTLFAIGLGQAGLRRRRAR